MDVGSFVYGSSGNAWPDEEKVGIIREALGEGFYMVETNTGMERWAYVGFRYASPEEIAVSKYMPVFYCVEVGADTGLHIEAPDRDQAAARFAAECDLDLTFGEVRSIDLEVSGGQETIRKRIHVRQSRSYFVENDGLNSAQFFHEDLEKNTRAV